MFDDMHTPPSSGVSNFRNARCLLTEAECGKNILLLWLELFLCRFAFIHECCMFRPHNGTTSTTDDMAGGQWCAQFHTLPARIQVTIPDVRLFKSTSIAGATLFLSPPPKPSYKCIIFNKFISLRHQIYIRYIVQHTHTAMRLLVGGTAKCLVARARVCKYDDPNSVGSS